MNNEVKNMVLGVGTDILKMERITGLRSLDDPFFRKTFTLREREEALTREHPARHFCTKFAVKEAVYKALKICGKHVSFAMIEVLNDENVAPFVVLHNEAEAAAEDLGVKSLEVSASYDGEYAVAMAVCTGMPTMRSSEL